MTSEHRAGPVSCLRGIYIAEEGDGRQTISTSVSAALAHMLRGRRGLQADAQVETGREQLGKAPGRDRGPLGGPVQEEREQKEGPGLAVGLAW